MKIAVAMSGGVDSSVTAALLQKEGHEVFGLTMLVTPSDEVATAAREAAETLGIPHHTVDFRDIFAREVIAGFCQQYGQGRTPNPCVNCNRLIKYGILLDKARELGAAAMATGHYVRIEKQSYRFVLRKGVDRTRDQSYFLYKLTQPQLASAIFPLGNLTKENVRKIASEMGLASVKRKESREICFIPDNDYPRFLREHLPAIPSGSIVDKQSKILGKHDGIISYTVGQRKGLGISSPEPLYVVGIDAQNNTVIVGRKQDVFSSEFIADDVNWVSIEKITAPLTLKVRIRYLHAEAEAVVTPVDNDKVNIKFAKPQMAVTPGQSAVFYDGDVVAGGGTIERVLN
jgi:tRNA-uridine 2-sulfurtransferase